ncbi:xanthine dehydrogenase family protein molybdopterin-binding subunit [Actinospongicola halichondriae]|uniref:xanthine dehydrogenase family protein molybdopterin-binding subunit n=1 Tax=Actinospongicola halichondriae TaxID=3236844 RepID=UPI003D3C5DC1
MSILGNRVLRTEDPRFLTAGGTYTADLRDPILDGALHVTFVRSMVAHGTITDIDLAEARRSPGVVAVYSADDLADMPLLPLAVPLLNPLHARPVLAVDKVRFVGEPVAVIVSETPEAGADAAESVWADIEFLPAVLTPEQALDGDTLLFDEVGDNVSLDLSFGEDDAPFDDCEVVVDGTFLNQRVAGCPLEVRSAAATWVDGRLVHFCSTQAPHGVKTTLQEWYGLDEALVRVKTPDVGGGFGPKIGAYPEEVILGWISKQLGRPVRWVETRSENMVGMGHGRGQWQTVKIGGDRDGRVKAYRLNVVQDSGAYPALGAFLTFMTRTMASGVYDIPAVQFNAKSIVTNTTPTVAYRGAGRPEATAAIERAMDLFAAEVGKDPADVRRLNLISSDAFPFTTPTDTVYDVGDYERSLDLALEAAGYAELRAEQAARRAEGGPIQIGIGVSVYVEVTAGPQAGQEYGRVVVHPDGTATAYTGSSSHGQGHDTSFAMLVNEALGIPIDDVVVLHGDTDEVARGVGTFGSRSLQLGGSAIHEASGLVVDKARQIAADLLEADPADLELDPSTGTFHVAGTPAVSRSWAEIATAAGPDGIEAETDFAATSPTFPFGAHVAVVEVDTETGMVRLVRMVTCDDAGTVLNPLIVEGQRHGGIAQGVAQAIYEHVQYDEDGNPVTANLADYTMISATELPSFELVTMETPTPHNPLGAKGIGESGTIGSTPAVQSAVCDALSELGIRHVDMPCTPERVWDAIRAVDGR